jgi:hypothetical protein
MECREVIEYLDCLDHEQELPTQVAAHLQHCPRCRREAALVSDALGVLRSSVDYDTLPGLTASVMRMVRENVGQAAAADPPTSLRNWIIIGAVIFAGVLGLRFSEVMTWLRGALGPAIDVAMSIFLGVFLTGYICMLVGSNMDRVLRIFRHR